MCVSHGDLKLILSIWTVAVFMLLKEERVVTLGEVKSPGTSALCRPTPCKLRKSRLREVREVA